MPSKETVVTERSLALVGPKVRRHFYWPKVQSLLCVCPLAGLGVHTYQAELENDSHPGGTEGAVTFVCLTASRPWCILAEQNGGMPRTPV